jgi:hypothetical protein
VRPIRLLILLSIASLLLGGCGDSRLSPEEEIRVMLQAGETAVESRSIGEVKPFLSADYTDENGYRQRDLLKLLTGYFLRNHSIHLLVQAERIELASESAADVILYVALAGRPLSSADQIIPFRADLYRFDLGLAREGGEWRVASGKWRRAEKADFLE